MDYFSTPAVLLRRINYGDHDLIVTFYSLAQGKITLMAKSAKKSQRRFGGLLDFFFLLNIVYAKKQTQLPILNEISLIESFDNIRSAITKTAYAGYWGEILAEGVAEGHEDPQLFALMTDMLRELNANAISEDILNIAFQLRFAALSGIEPNLASCVYCHIPLANIRKPLMGMDITIGGIVCPECQHLSKSYRLLEKGTIMQLRWLNTANMEKIRRIRCSQPSLAAGAEILEAFVSFHCGKKLKSLQFLKSIRNEPS